VRLIANASIAPKATHRSCPILRGASEAPIAVSNSRTAARLMFCAGTLSASAALCPRTIRIAVPVAETAVASTMQTIYRASQSEVSTRQRTTQMQSIQ
jgi:hypothetical protein